MIVNMYACSITCTEGLRRLGLPLPRGRLGLRRPHGPEVDLRYSVIVQIDSIGVITMICMYISL